MTHGVDRSVLAALEADVGSDEALSLVAMVVDEARRLRAVLDTALAGGDAPAGQQAAHTLRSLAALVGATTLRDRSATTEDLLAAGRLDEARAGQTMLIGALDPAIEALGHYLGTGDS